MESAASEGLLTGESRTESGFVDDYTDLGTDNRVGTGYFTVISVHFPAYGTRCFGCGDQMQQRQRIIQAIPTERRLIKRNQTPQRKPVCVEDVITHAIQGFECRASVTMPMTGIFVTRENQGLLQSIQKIGSLEDEVPGRDYGFRGYFAIC